MLRPVALGLGGATGGDFLWLIKRETTVGGVKTVFTPTPPIRYIKLFVTEGEVLLRSPAQWLAGTFVLAPPRRVAAPAALDCGEIDSITAVGAVKIQIEEAEAPLEKLRSAWHALRFAWHPAAH